MQTRNFPERTHIFTVDGERLFTFDWNPGTGAITERWTLRDLDGSVLTAYETDGGNAGTWRWTQDYVYRHGTMLASRVRFDDGSIGVRDYVVDHLGTPRLIGDRFDGLRTQHFFGFGEPIDLATSSSDPERKRFTGHERDLGTLGRAGGVQVELDYMRARFCSPWTARFLSVDPARESARLQRPQTWNRYSYAFNNPVTLVDPDGRVVESAWDAFNVGLGIKNLAENIASGNASEATVDSFALALDTAALLIPGTPGGASSAVKASRTSRSQRATKATKSAEIHASTPVGRRTKIGARGADATAANQISAHRPQHVNAPYQVRPPQNAGGRIGNVDFSGHAFDQMRNRGLTPTVIENTLRNGKKSKGNDEGTFVFYDEPNSVRVVVNEDGRVISVE